MAEHSNLRRTADRLTGGLEGYVKAHRKNNLSWRSIAAELEREHDIAISHQTLLDWFGESERQWFGTSERRSA